MLIKELNQQINSAQLQTIVKDMRKLNPPNSLRPIAQIVYAHL